MKKEGVLLLIALLFVGIFATGFVLAESGSGNGEGDDGDSGSSESGSSGNSGDSDSDSDKSSDSSKSSDNKDSSGSSSDKKQREIKKTITDESGNKVEVRTKTETKNGEEKTEERRTFTDENGNKIVVVTESKTIDGKTETEVKRKITTPSGNEITIKTKTRTEEGRERVTNSIEVKGAEVETKLSVREETKEGVPRLKAKLSTGVEQDIIILPDEALQTALAELETTNNFAFELKENVEGDLRTVVFSARASKPGKFLGIFNTNIDLETLIDAETGEVIKTNRPWWTFLVTQENKTFVCHVASEDSNKRNTLEVAIPAVKAHLGHGDSVGECAVICGDGLIVEGVEACDDGNVVDGDGCSSICEIEVAETPTTEETIPETNASKVTA